MDHRTNKKTAAKAPAERKTSAGSAAEKKTASGRPAGKKGEPQMPKRLRPWVLIPLILAAVVLGVLIWLVIFLSQRVGTEQKPQTKTGLSVEQYLVEYRDGVFSFESWDETTGTLRLTAPINTYHEVTLEKAKKYALLEDVRFDQMALSDVDTLWEMHDGWEGERSIGLACGIDVKNIVLSRLSSDGEIVYTVDLDGVQWHCWTEPQ